MNWYNKLQMKKIQKTTSKMLFGYKIVGVKKDTNTPYSIYSKEPVDISLGKEYTYDGKGLFLGTSRQFCLDYYSCGTEDEDGELILTYSYDEDDIINGDPNYQNGEIQVGKAILINIEKINKEEIC